jgi:hypothetical protein
MQEAFGAVRYRAGNPDRVDQQVSDGDAVYGYGNHLAHRDKRLVMLVDFG